VESSLWVFTTMTDPVVANVGPEKASQPGERKLVSYLRRHARLPRSILLSTELTG
jgi:hypothetical protein